MQDDKSSQSQKDHSSQDPKDGIESDDTFKKNIVFLSVFGTGVILFLCWSGLKDQPKDFWQVFITGTLSYLIFLAMFVQSRVSKMQWQAMQDGLDKTQAVLDQNERHFSRSERPILVIDKVKADIRPSHPIDPIIVNISNKGRSPAVKIGLVFNVSRPPANASFDFHGASRIDIPLWAGQDSHELIINNEHERGSLPLSLTEFDAIVTGTKDVYIYGEGVYEDSSENRYVLEKWAFRWTKDYGFVNDPQIIPFCEAFNRTGQK